jgi:predicted RNA methylase
MRRRHAPEGGLPNVLLRDRPPELSLGSRVPLHTLVHIREALRTGRLVDDRAFDSVYPEDIRRLSPTHWTPIHAALRAANLLAWKPRARVLDIGSGVGKFCIVAAAATHSEVLGVEHRPHLVEIAERATAQLGLDVRYTCGTLGDCNPTELDGIYLFNPFAENVCPPEDRIDDSVVLSAVQAARHVVQAEEFLHDARVGVRVVTYHGFGGELPPGYVCLTRERCSGLLELWVKLAGAGS